MGENPSSRSFIATSRQASVVALPFGGVALGMASGAAVPLGAWPAWLSAPFTSLDPSKNAHASPSGQPAGRPAKSSAVKGPAPGLSAGGDGLDGAGCAGLSFNHDGFRVCLADRGGGLLPSA